MFAPKLAKPQTKAAGSASSKPASRYPLARRDSSLTGSEPRRQDDPDPGQASRVMPGVSWDFSKIPVFPHDPIEQSLVSPPSSPGILANAEAIRQATVENRTVAPPTSAAFSLAAAQAHMRDDASADRSARLLNAQAVAFGNQILFRRGYYDPGTARGRALIAHELTHVAHQLQTGHFRPQRLVSGDVLSVNFTQDMAKAMTDDELTRQMNLLRSHLQNQPGDTGAAENLSVLEAEAYRRQGTAGGPPSAPSTPAPQPAPEGEAQPGRGSWFHRTFGIPTKHERAEILRKGWGPPLMLTDKDGEVIDVEKLSDDEIIKLDQERRGLPIVHAGISAIPSAPAGWSGTQSEFGKEIEWPARGKVVTPAENVDLAKLQRAGVTEEWATQQAQIYREIARDNPANPTAALRAEWLEKVAARLRGGP